MTSSARRSHYDRKTRTCSRRCAAAGLVAVLTMMALASPARASRATADPLAPKQGALLGAHAEDASGNVGQDALSGLESLLGHKLAIDHFYRPWGTVFPTTREPWDFSSGRIPMISWGKTDLAQIIAGAHDDYIRRRASAVALLRKPVFLRWFWEMDGHNNGNGGFFDVTPQDYIAAWRHIYDLFVAQGAMNAVWVWCPNAWNFETGRSQQYYPGDAYVDWICADGYDWFPARGKDRSFKEIFQAFYTWGSPRGKPLMVGEWGALESGPTHKSAWLEDARATLRSTFPKIAAIVYFNHKGLPHEVAGIDWRVQTSRPALAAFTAMATDPYFNPGAGGGGGGQPPPVIPEVGLPLALPVSALVVILAIGLLSRRRWRPAS